MSSRLLSKTINYANFEDYVNDFDKLTFCKKYQDEDVESIKLLKERIQNNTSVCHMFYYEKKVVGLVSLSFERISSNKNDSTVALCVDFLFVSHLFRKRQFKLFRISHDILDFVIATLYGVNNNIGSIWNVILLPANKELIRFYKKYGFKKLDNHWLYFNINQNI